MRPQDSQETAEETPESIADWRTSLLVLLALAEEIGPEEMSRLLRERTPQKLLGRSTEKGDGQA